MIRKQPVGSLKGSLIAASSLNIKLEGGKGRSAASTLRPAAAAADALLPVIMNQSQVIYLSAGERMDTLFQLSRKINVGKTFQT